MPKSFAQTYFMNYTYYLLGAWYTWVEEEGEEGGGGGDLLES